VTACRRHRQTIRGMEWLGTLLALTSSERALDIAVVMFEAWEGHQIEVEAQTRSENLPEPNFYRSL
jgi:hypothetical protein